MAETCRDTATTNTMRYRETVQRWVGSGIGFAFCGGARWFAGVNAAIRWRYAPALRPMDSLSPNLASLSRACVLTPRIQGRSRMR